MNELVEIILTSALVVWAYMTLFYLLALAGKNASVADSGWGMGFILISTVLLNKNLDLSLLQMMVHILITVWGVRLAVHIFTRNLGRDEDWRYANWRREWGKHYPWRSYFQIFMLQGASMLVIAAPIFISNMELGANSLRLSAYIGMAIWAVGFFFESIGDFQLQRFVRDPKTKGKIMKSGVWKYTRHPNYFGEVTQWWGLFVMVIGAPYWWLAIVSPGLITFLLLKVSGIPMLEKKWAKVKEYQDYKKRTSAFFPWPPKPAKSK